MEQLQLPDKTTPDQERFYRQLLEGALGQIIELDAVPTGDALQAGEIGYHNGVVYAVTPDGGNKIKWSVTSWS